MLSSTEQMWVTAHAYVCTLLELKRNNGFWFTGKQSWNLMKWNACGPVVISEEAIAQFFKHPALTKASKASDFGGGGNARCFVAEHIYPIKQLQALVLRKFENQNPSLEEFRSLFTRYNRICYVWHQEDRRLSSLGLRSSLPSNCEPESLFARYEAAGINALDTDFQTGTELCKSLDKCRSEGMTRDQAIRAISND